MEQNEEIDNDKSKSGESPSWGGQTKNIYCFNPGEHPIFRGTEEKDRSQSLRGGGANIEGTHTPFSFEQRNFLDQGSLLELFKKLACRLELLEKKYAKYVADHRSRLISRLNEHEQFALDVQPEMEQLRKDIDGITRVLGASTIE
nr:hypothetical protein [Okeania sp. SIO3I5]